MNYRNLGASGLKVSEVSLGAWLTYGGSVEDATAVACIQRAVDLGVNFIDVADVYARGVAEIIVGRAIRELDRSHLVISSKVYWPMSEDVNDRGLSRKHIMESAHKSLRRLGTDYLDIYFCHRYDSNTPLEETVRAMDDLVRQGKVLYWGTSVWSGEQLRETAALCEERGYYAPRTEQPRYNLFDREIETNGVLDAAGELGLGLVVWSPLAQGLLTGKYDKGAPAGTRGSETHWLEGELTESNIEKVRRLGRIARALDMSVGQLALAWCLRHRAVSSVITGATAVHHVDENVRAAGKSATLDADVLAHIDALFGAPSP
jgi:voltage-dependent potassium channel beta subunit